MLYLAPWVRHPSRSNGWVPRNAEAGPFSCIDLRPDPTDGAGYCLLWVPRSLTDAALIELAADPADPIPPDTRRVLANRLGIEIAAKKVTAGDVLSDLLMQDRGKWACVRAARNGKACVTLDGRDWYVEQRASRTGSFVDPEDDFNRANESPLGNGTWTTLTSSSGLAILGNDCQPNSLTTDCASRWSAGDAFDDDQYSQVLIVVRESGSDEGPGPLIRAAAAARSYYACYANAVDEISLFRYVAATYAVLARGGTCANADTLRIEGEGTTIRTKVNGDGTGQPSVTDANLTSGRPGVAAFATTTAGDAQLDDWEGADLVAAGGGGDDGGVQPERDGEADAAEVHTIPSDARRSITPVAQLPASTPRREAA